MAAIASGKREIHSFKLKGKRYSIYSLICPICKKPNISGAIKCWNCGYNFLKVQDVTEEEFKDIFLFVVAGVLAFVLIGIILWINIGF